MGYLKFIGGATVGLLFFLFLVPILAVMILWRFRRSIPVILAALVVASFILTLIFNAL